MLGRLLSFWGPVAFQGRYLLNFGAVFCPWIPRVFMSKLHLCLTSRSVPNQCYQLYLLTGAIRFGKSVATDGLVERKKPWWKKWGKTPMFLFNPYFLNDFGVFPQKITEGDPRAIDLEGEFHVHLFAAESWAENEKTACCKRKPPCSAQDTFRSKLRTKTSEVAHRRRCFFVTQGFHEKNGKTLWQGFGK